jgi:hypothetical protein
MSHFSYIKKTNLVQKCHLRRKKLPLSIFKWANLDNSSFSFLVRNGTSGSYHFLRKYGENKINSKYVYEEIKI